MGVGDGETGITRDFDSLVPGSYPGPRASVPDHALYGDESVGAVSPSTQKHLYSNVQYPAPCRLCGGPSWLTDDEGAVHPCCELMWEPESGCRSCNASASLNAGQRRRGKGRRVQPESYKGAE